MYIQKCEATAIMSLSRGENKNRPRNERYSMKPPMLARCHRSFLASSATPDQTLSPTMNLAATNSAACTTWDAFSFRLPPPVLTVVRYGPLGKHWQGEHSNDGHITIPCLHLLEPAPRGVWICRHWRMYTYDVCVVAYTHAYLA